METGVPSLTLTSSIQRLSLISSIRSNSTQNLRYMRKDVCIGNGNYLQKKDSRRNRQSIGNGSSKYENSYRSILNESRNSFLSSQQPIRDSRNNDQRILEYTKNSNNQKNQRNHEIEQMLKGSIDIKMKKINAKKGKQIQTNPTQIQKVNKSKIQPKFIKQIRKKNQILSKQFSQQRQFEKQNRYSPKIIAYGLNEREYDPYYPHESLKQIINTTQNFKGSHITKTEYKISYPNQQIQNDEVPYFKNDSKSNKKKSFDKITSIKLIDKDNSQTLIDEADFSCSSVNNYSSKLSVPAFKQSKSSSKKKIGISVYSSNKDQGRYKQVESVFRRIEESVVTLNKVYESENELSTEAKVEERLQSIEKMLLGDELDEQIGNLDSIKDSTSKQCQKNLQWMDQIINKHGSHIKIEVQQTQADHNTPKPKLFQSLLQKLKFP